MLEVFIAGIQDVTVWQKHLHCIIAVLCILRKRVKPVTSVESVQVHPEQNLPCSVWFKHLHTEVK